jgi:hypothetical protein
MNSRVDCWYGWLPRCEVRSSSQVCARMSFHLSFSVNAIEFGYSQIAIHH